MSKHHRKTDMLLETSPIGKAIGRSLWGKVSLRLATCTSVARVILCSSHSILTRSSKGKGPEQGSCGHKSRKKWNWLLKEHSRGRWGSTGASASGRLGVKSIGPRWKAERGFWPHSRAMIWQRFKGRTQVSVGIRKRQVIDEWEMAPHKTKFKPQVSQAWDRTYRRKTEFKDLEGDTVYNSLSLFFFYLFCILNGCSAAVQTLLCCQEGYFVPTCACACACMCDL